MATVSSSSVLIAALNPPSLVVDGTSGNLLAESAAAYGLIPGLGAGAKEQHPHTWKEATKRSITRALKACKAKKEEVVSIG